MPTAEKAQVIEQARDWYSRSVGVVFTDYRGLSVKEVQDLRRQLRSKGAELHVVKNTLFRLAAGEDVERMPDEFHNGTTAIAFVFENESEVAKSLLDFAKANKKLNVKGGFFGGRPFNPKEVEALSSLPTKDVLISQVIGLIAAPIGDLIGTIEALYADPIRVIGAVADKVGEGSGETTSQPAEEPAGEQTVVPEATAAPAENEPSVEAEGEAATPVEGGVETGEGSPGSEEATS